MSAVNDEKPLYQKVKESILAQINDGSLRPGDLLPTEPVLEEMYNVSRTTIRAAIGELQRDGYISRQQGRGTFVANNSYEDCRAVLQSFTQELSRQGKELHTTPISLDLIIPDECIRDEMGIGDQPVLRIFRIRSIDGLPTILSTSYLPKRIYEKLDWKNIDLTDRSLYRLLEDAGIVFESGEEIVEICTASEYEASLLKIDAGSPLARNRRKVYDPDGQLIELGSVVTRGDQYRLHINLQRRK